jgi:hypothetical protein
LTILIIFGKEYKVWRSLLCSFLQPPTISSLYNRPQSVLTWVCLYTIFVERQWTRSTTNKFPSSWLVVDTCLAQ